MAVITISRQYGSGGDEIATRVCEMLGYRFFDKRLMVQVASEVGLSESQVVDFSETDYKVQSFLERLFARRSPRIVAQTRTWKMDITGTRTMEIEQLDEEWCIRIVRGSIEAAYRQGNVVIVGRGGQAILQDRPDVLHVRIETPSETRIERVQHRGVPGVTPEYRRATAEQMVSERSRAAAEYLKRFYDIDWDDPMLYHLVINADKWGIDAAAHLIVNAVSYLPLTQSREAQ